MLLQNVRLNRKLPMLKSFNKKYDDNTNQDRKNDCRNSQVKGIRAGVGLVIRKMHVFPVI